MNRFVSKVDEFKPPVTSDSIQLFCEDFPSLLKNMIYPINITNIELPSLKTLLENMTGNGGDGRGGNDAEKEYCLFGNSR